MSMICANRTRPGVIRGRGEERAPGHPKKEKEFYTGV